VSNPLEALLDLSAATSRFPPNSRYHGVATATRVLPDGRTVAYLRRRFAPDPDALATMAEHPVQQGDRLDNLAALYLSDPELFWRICDGNGAMRPADLTATVGRRLRVTLPEGTPEPARG
jgi:hypothetical protein